MIENKTDWVIGLACARAMMSPSIVVVVSLKPERICPAEFNIPKENFIWLKAGSCNKSTSLSGSTSTLCTSKPIIHRVSPNAS